MNVELLAPAGDFKTALSAFAAGADAVYCGLADFSARAFAKNLSCDELKQLVSYARQPGQRHRSVYVTFNTLVDEDQLDAAVEQLARLDEIGSDGIIVQDLGVANLCRKHFPRLELHASTQLVAHNLEGVLELKDIGFRRVVLARELSLDEIASIASRCGALREAEDGRPELELECFIHGALCYSLSGLCLFGAMEKGRSGNRGTCPYCCRQGFQDADGRGGLFYPFSMRDLRLGEDARRLVEAGVASLKIEGRMKTPLYVASVTKYYRQILDGSAAVSSSQGQTEDGLATRGAQAAKQYGDVTAKQYGDVTAKQYGDVAAKPDGNVARPSSVWHGSATSRVTPADLETVFSRRTTELYFNGRAGTGKSPSPVDPESLGHLGTAIGTVKRITRDRDGRAWLRFHTARGLEKHDGLQFDATGEDGRHLGLGIVEMRQAISRRPVFEVNAGVDVEILLPEPEGEPKPWAALKTGMKIYCSMSNAVKRMFPTPSFRPSDYPGTCVVDLKVTLSEGDVTVEANLPRCQTEDGLATRECASEVASPNGNVASPDGNVARPSSVWHGSATANASPDGNVARPSSVWHGSATANASPDGNVARASSPLQCANVVSKHPEKTLDAIRKAFSKFGGTDYRLGRLTVEDPKHIFVPMSQLNDLRRDLVEKLDAARLSARQAKLDAIADDRSECASLRAASDLPPMHSLKVRLGQKLPPGAWDEIVIAVDFDSDGFESSLADIRKSAGENTTLRLALPVYTAEPAFGRLRSGVKRLLRDGWARWECSDLATLRLLRSLGVIDLTADWSLYAFNAEALSLLSDRGVVRFVASPENGRENLQFLCESGSSVVFMEQQSTPLFISLTQPAADREGLEGLRVFRRDGLWVTTRQVPRTFAVPKDAPRRLDLSWDPT